MERGERIKVAASPVASRKEVVSRGDGSDYNDEEKKLDCSDVGSPSAIIQNNSTLGMASSRRTTVDYAIPTSRCRTKSWTDHRAPEPFTSPTPQKSRRRKYGYGDLYRSTSSGSSAVEDRIRYPHSYHSSGKAKIAFDRRRTTDASGANVQLIEKQPSFTFLDFPVLSPVKSKAPSSKHEERSLTWSSVVGEDKQASGEEAETKNNEDLHGIIPPLPFGDDVTTKSIDESESFNISSSSALQNNVLSDAVDMSSDNWHEPKNHPRQRSQSVYSAFSFPGKTGKLPTQPPTFCTMSIAALQNDIGTLLVRANRVDEAVERYKLSIQSARDKINDLQNKTQANDFESKLKLMSNSNEQCPVQASEGLAWFRTKLLRGDVVPATSNTLSPIDHQNNDEAPLKRPYQPAGFGGCAPSSPRRLRSASFCVFDSHYNEHTQTPLQVHPFRRTSTPRITPKPPILPIDDIVQDIHQHQKLDCPEDVYSCNGRTPLGLEFICDPLPILGRSLREVVVDLSDKDARVTIETVALIAATINLAALEYRAAGGGASDKLQQVVDTLQSCQSCFAEGECGSQSNNFFVLLKTIAHVNIGTCLYRLNKVRDATQNFEQARDTLLKYKADTEADAENLGNSHDDDRSPPREYLLLVIRVNLSRAMLRLKKYDDAQKLCNEIAEDNKPHRRHSRSQLKPSPLPHAYGFRRSNSYLATSSALETAIVAYDHEIDRRSKWLFSVAEHFLVGMVHEAKGDTSDQKEAWHHYNRLLSLARTKLDHRHPHICSLLERRGAVLFSQRKLQCSMLSYLACLHILEYQQSNGSNIFNQADMARVLYGIARVLHDKEEYQDALGMYHRALGCQREISINSTRPSLDVVTTLCNISRVHHLAGDLEAALCANKEVLELATILVGGKLDHPFLIHRLKIEGNILIEAGRLSDAMCTFVDAARRCSEDGRNRMVVTMMGGAGHDSNSQEDADAGDSSVLSVRSAATIAHSNCFHPGAAAA